MFRAGTLALAILLVGGAGEGAEPVRPAPAPSPASAPVRYRIETAGLGVIWAEDHPLQSGDQVTFHRYPGGTLVSIKRSDVRRVSSERLLAPPSYVDVGLTGGGSRPDPTASAAAGPASRSGKPELPGARPDGTALFNPDRKYQPDIDAKRVPGVSTGFPNSPNDYREGRTIGFPAAPAAQQAPGEPPKMPAGTGAVPQ